MSRKLHIVSFDVPFPPNYGGAIDVFYKLKELHSLGIHIYLYTYEYGRGRQIELEKYCTEVHYYSRSSFFTSFFSKSPFTVKSRSSKALIKKLKSVKDPILFEGLQTTYPLLKTNFKVPTFVRAHNIEHLYYKGLAQSTSSFFKKLFFKIEAKKLKRYEAILEKAHGIFTISPSEQIYFKQRFKNQVYYVPAFHNNITPSTTSPKGDFILFHGDLRVSDNIKAALFAIDIYENSHFHLVIATSYKTKSILKRIKHSKNIELKHIDTEKDLEELLKKAHLNFLFTFQKTGIKLKLLNVLYRGKFIIANKLMVEDTGLEKLISMANTKTEVLQQTEFLFTQDFKQDTLKKRQLKLDNFNPKVSAKKIVDMIFNS